MGSFPECCTGAKEEVKKSSQTLATVLSSTTLDTKKNIENMDFVNSKFLHLKNFDIKPNIKGLL